MKLNALRSALLALGAIAVLSPSAHATFGPTDGLGSICTTPSIGNCDVFGNPFSGGVCTVPNPVVCDPIVPTGGLGSVCNIFGGSTWGNNFGGSCDLFGNPIGGNGGGINCLPGGGGSGSGGGKNNCNPGGGTNPVPEPGTIALLVLGATALGGTVLRRRK